jgi:hypothetical protein
MTETIRRKRKLCFKVKRNKSPSLPTSPADAVATAMGWGEIIFPVTPPVELAATVSVGSMSIWLAVIFCKLPKRALEEVSLPVRKTPVLYKYK